MKELDNIYNRLLSGDCTVTDDERKLINDIAMKCMHLLEHPVNQVDVNNMLTILRISNAIYNNAPDVILPLDDRIYDSLVNICKILNIPSPIGAPPINFTVYDKHRIVRNPSDQTVARDEDGKIQVVKIIPNIEQKMFYQTLTHNPYTLRPEECIVHQDNTLVNKKSRNVSHRYDMCGTLDKCNYVLVDDARKRGQFYNHEDQIFEKDFLGKHVAQGIIDPNWIEVIISLKYDGISVEEDIQGSRVLGACTRGDTANDEASDLTPILGGMEFAKAKGLIDESERFGVKFEFIITNYNMERIRHDFGKSYANNRNAVIGLLGGLDARKYRDYLTPVPLESSLNMPREVELEFLNKYYSKDVNMRYAIIKGNYTQVLFMIKQFTTEAENLRDTMGFQYDGVVVEYADQRIRDMLGKRGAIPRYAIAIKFNPLQRVSIFEGYTFSVGQNGMVVPMAHFKPVEFFGAIHDKTTVHSLKRFRDLDLRKGDKVLLTLKNDVIVYLSKIYNQDKNPNPPEQFPTTCPACGEPLYTSETGNTAFCLNFFCPERCVGRLSNMLAKLNIKDISTQTIRALDIHNVRELMSVPSSILLSRLGPVAGQNYKDRIESMRNGRYTDYRILGSIGFSSIATETWKLILNHISLNMLITNPEEMKSLSFIKGIGKKTVETIVKEWPLFKDDISYILQTFPNIIYTNPGTMNKRKIRFTGVRDAVLEDMFNQKGYDANGEQSVTNDTYMLIVPYAGYMSGKVKKAFKILTKDYDLRTNSAEQINYNNLYKCKDLAPFIFTVDEAYQFIKNQK